MVREVVLRSIGTSSVQVPRSPPVCMCVCVRTEVAPRRRKGAFIRDHAPVMTREREWHLSESSKGMASATMLSRAGFPTLFPTSSAFFLSCRWGASTSG